MAENKFFCIFCTLYVRSNAIRKINTGCSHIVAADGNKIFPEKKNLELFSNEDYEIVV
jgi:hypothetical protein